MADHPYATALAGLQAEQKRLLTELAAVESAIKSLEPLVIKYAASAVTLDATREVDIIPPQPLTRAQPYLGKTIAEAAEMYLREKSTPQKTEHIVAGLRTGGVALQAANPSNVVHSTLYRKDDVFVKVGRGLWALKPAASIHPALE